MTDIPEDVIKAADDLWASGGDPDELGGVPLQYRLFTKYLIVQAIMAERERCAASVEAWKCEGVGAAQMRTALAMIAAGIRKGEA